MGRKVRQNCGSRRSNNARDYNPPVARVQRFQSLVDVRVAVFLELRDPLVDFGHRRQHQAAKGLLVDTGPRGGQLAQLGQDGGLVVIGHVFMM